MLHVADPRASNASRGELRDALGFWQTAARKNFLFDLGVASRGAGFGGHATMTAALTKALETYDKNWLSAGLDHSCLRVINGVIYAVVIGRSESVLAIYRVSKKRLAVTKAEMWPTALVHEFASKRLAMPEVATALPSPEKEREMSRLTRDGLTLTVEGASTEDLERGLRAAKAVFESEDISPEAAARAVWDLEAQREQLWEEHRELPSEAQRRAAIWVIAYDEAIAACCEGRTPPYGTSLSLAN